MLVKMPLYLRRVEPVSVGRGHGEMSAGPVASQEEAANRALANLVRQMASLGRHAGDIFGKDWGLRISVHSAH